MRSVSTAAEISHARFVTQVLGTENENDIDKHRVDRLMEGEVVETKLYIATRSCLGLCVREYVCVSIQTLHISKIKDRNRC